jgi:outer membrane protein assembly factor BamB
VYLSDGAQVYGVRLNDGTEVWHYPEKPDAKLIFYATPAVLPDGRALIGSAGNDHCMHIIDPSTIDAATKTAAGRCFFAGAQDHWVTAPLVAADTIYAPNNDGFLYVIDLKDGSLIWSLEIGGHLWATPVIGGGKLYVPSLDHKLYAVDLERREIVWDADLGGSIAGSPALSADGQSLFIGSFAARVFALNAENGAIRWQRDTKGWVWGGPAVSGDTVYAADLEGQVYALDAATGSVNWTMQPDGPVTGSPLVMKDAIAVTTESGSVYVVDSAGKNVWVASVKGKVYTPAIQSGDKLLVAPLSSGAEYFLSAFNPNGSLAWPFKPGNL